MGGDAVIPAAITLFYFEKERGTPLVWLSGSDRQRGHCAKGGRGVQGSQPAGTGGRVEQLDAEVSWPPFHNVWLVRRFLTSG